MQIRKGKPADLSRILELYSEARTYMAEMGNPDQWKDTWPPVDLIIDDIDKEMNYVCEDDNGNVVGTFYIGYSPDPTYLKIYNGQWLDDDSNYVIIHRITTDQNTRGVGKFIFEWVHDTFGNIRIDTHENNIPMKGLLKSQGFTYCGIIFLENGEERIAYQKL